MAFLTLNGTTVPVRANALGQKNEEHRLDRDRMFDGTMRVIRGGTPGIYGTGVYRSFDVVTRYLTQSDADAIEAIVNGDSIPLAMDGDCIENLTIAVIPVPGTRTRIQTANGVRHQLTFTLKETPAPLPADTSAALYLACLRGKGYWKDFAKATAAGDGDFVHLWEDQTGNTRDLRCLTSLGGHNGMPKLEGDLLHFGISANDVAGAPATSRSLLAIPTAIPTTGYYGTLSGAEIMMSFRLAAYPPGSDATAGLWMLGKEGRDGTYFTKPDGHIYESAFADTAGADLGVPPDDPSAGLVVYSVGANSSGWTVTFNGSTIYSGALLPGASAGFYVDRIAPAIGAANGGDAHYLNGWVRDVVINTAPFTTSQRRSWYQYMIGLTDDAPLP